MTDETRDRIDNSAVAYGKKFDQDYRGYAAEDWAEGATSEHPISYEAGRKAGIEHLANVVISGIDARELDAHGRIPASTVKAIIKRELEALKNVKP